MVDAAAVDQSHKFQADALYRDLNYNLGDMLNMPSYSRLYKWPLDNVVKKTRAYNVSLIGKKTLLGFYFSKYEDYDNSRLILDGSRYPNVTHLHRAVAEYGKYNEKYSPPIVHLAEMKKNDTLLVHIRSGDFGGIGLNFTIEIITITKKENFHHVILMSGAHNDTRWGAQMNNSATVIDFEIHHLKSLLMASKINTTVHYGTNPDHDMYLMSKASNLLIHRGGYSVLGAIICSGNVFVPRSMDYYQLSDEFKQLIKLPHYLLR